MEKQHSTFFAHLKILKWHNFTVIFLWFKIQASVGLEFMRQIIISILLVLLVGNFIFAQDVPAASLNKSSVQDKELSRNFGDFTLELPNANWRVVSQSPNAEIIYGDRRDGLLQIRKVTIDDGETFANVIDREQTQKLQFLPGFVNGKEENFKGFLSGKVANYESVSYTHLTLPTILRV